MGRHLLEDDALNAGLARSKEGGKCLWGRTWGHRGVRYPYCLIINLNIYMFYKRPGGELLQELILNLREGEFY